MNITELAFRNRPLVYLVLAVSVLAGVANYFTLPAQEDPSILIREAIVSTDHPGLPTEKMELLITKPLEERIRSMPELKEIRSVTRPGNSTIHVVIDDKYFDLDQLWDDLRQTVAEVRLPAGTHPPFINDDFGDVAVVTAALTGADYSPAELHTAAKHVKDRLYAVPGTKKVELLGVRPQRIFIEISNAKMAELGVTPAQLEANLARTNIITPGGSVDVGDASLVVEPSGDFHDLDDIRDTLIRVPGGALVAVRDFATVTRGYQDPPTKLAYFNGAPAIIFAVSMHAEVRVLDYGPRIQDTLTAVAQELPAGLELELVTYQAEVVSKAVYGVTENVGQTLAVVLAVVILFLGVRTGLIVGAIVPGVMLITLTLMGVFGMKLERMSLATLVIALGLLVDNGIVVAEDFKRRLESGVDRMTALRDSGGELAMPLLSSSLTTVLVFLPLMLAEHASGEYTRSISLVILMTLLVSWLLAMTVTPLLCYRFLPDPKPDAQTDGGFARAGRVYEWFLRGMLRQRVLIMVLSVALLGVAGFGMSKVPKKFFPESDRTQVLAYIDLPAGTGSRGTERALTRVLPLLSDRESLPYVRHNAAYMGFGGPRFVLSLSPIDPAPNVAFVVFDIDRPENMDRAVADLRGLFAQHMPEANVDVAKMFLGPSDPSVFQLQLKGPDARYIQATADKVEQVLLSVPGTIHIERDWENLAAQLKVDIDPTRARRAGLTATDVAGAMAQHLSGRTVTRFREGDESFPIVLRAPPEERAGLTHLKTLRVFGQDGRSAPVEGVATLSTATQFARIAREDLTRTLTFTVRNEQITPEDLVPLIAPKIAALNAELPLGHRIEIDGIVKESGEGQAALAANAPLCLGLMVILLVAQFRSYRRPAIILLTIPLVVVGAALGLHAMQADFGFMVILGLYALAGIIVNNAIVLIDRIDLERAADDSAPLEAVIRACRLRLRPIVMTTVTTILGLVPLILARDPLFYGMSAVIGFGLLVGTFLSLGVVPVLYCLLFKIRGTPRSRPEPAPKAESAPNPVALEEVPA